MSIGAYTDNFSIPLSNFDTPTWVDEDWARWRLLDALVAATESLDDVPFVVSTGAANAYVLTYSPAITALASGDVLSFKTNFAVTGAATVNVNGLGAKALKINGADLEEDDLPINTYVRMIYDGTEFHLIDPKKPVNMNQNIITGDSGCTPNASTDFYVESDGPTFVELLGPVDLEQGFMFSRPDLSYAGGTKYDHTNNLFIIRVNGQDVANVDENGKITASSFSGPLTGAVTGNADTASKWQTARTITLGADAAGSVSIDGSANVTLNINLVNDSVSNAKLANMATQTFKGRTSSGGGDPEDLTVTQATAMLNAVAGDSGSGGTKGLVPAPAAGDAAADKYLHADGTWTAPIAAKGIFDAAGATVSAVGMSCARTGPGAFDITLSPAMANDDYAVFVSVNDNTRYFYETRVHTKLVGSFKINTVYDDAGVQTAGDPTDFSILVVAF